MAPTLLVLLGAAAILRADVVPDEFSLLPPVNFTIKVTSLAQVLLSWKPNPDQERRGAQLGYHLRIHAPQDDDYELKHTARKYGSQTEECRQYSQDSRRRHVACWFPTTSIDGKGQDALAVRVSGWSPRAAIRPYERLFALHEIDEVNPPGNVTAAMEGTRLSIRWERPVSAFPDHCWDYEVKVANTRKDYVQIENTTTNKFNTTVSNISKYRVAVRAAVSVTCRRQGLWSAWSRPIDTGKDEPKPWTEWLLIPLTAALCAAFVCLLGRRTGHICAKLFPPVPGPKSDIGDLMATVNYQKTGSGETESEVISYVEEEHGALEDLVF
ncbi:interleukin-5 receptor subunit alpha isoform 3-T3 [Glossophaga mutica]